jgi:LysM repeat protein
MKPFVLRSVVVAALLLVPFLALFRWQVAMSTPPTRAAVGTLSGMAQVLPAGAENSKRTTTQATIEAGDTVRALAAVRLTLADGSIIMMEPGAVVTVRTAKDDGSPVVFHEAGRLSVETNNPAFRLQSSNLTLAVDKAQFRAEISPTGDAYVVAEHGLVYGTSEGETVTVAEGESMHVGAGQRARLLQSTPVVVPPPPPAPPRTPTPTVTPVPPTQPPTLIHVIEQGDTLTYLAQKYNVTVDAIMKANNIQDPNLLMVGDKLIIPQAKK